jgi:type IV secretion system protein VirB6
MEKASSLSMLLYGIGTLFSMATLSVVSSMVLGLTAKVSAAYWTATVINSIMGNNAEGLTNQAMQQGGIGLLMTVLIISVPPMAAMFFQGTVGSFMHFSAFSGGASRPGPQGQPPGSYGASPEKSASVDTTKQSSGLLGRTSVSIGAPTQDIVKMTAERPSFGQGT